MDKSLSDERAYELLQWQALAPLQSFDEEECYPYAEMQRKRSNAALDAWEKEHRYETSSELAAFRELERLGVFTQSDYYSPSKASNGDYTKRLKQHQGTSSGGFDMFSPSCRASDQNGKGAGLAPTYEEQGVRARRRSRRKRY